MRFASLALGLLLSSSPCVAAATTHDAVPLQAKAKKKALSDEQIKKLLIEESIAAYSGSCPCPYSTARNGSRCGRRSAYSREGGAEPLCYAKDVSAALVREYRDAHPDE